MKNFIPYILIAVSIGLFYMHIDPRYTEVQALQKEKNEYVAALSKIEQLQEQKNQILAVFNAIPKTDMDRLSRLLPEKLNTVKLIADMDGIAGNYGVTIGSIKVAEEAVDRAQQVSSEAQSKPYRTTAVSFKFTASYDTMVLFLRDMERSLQLIDVSSITFTVAEDKKETDGFGLNNYNIVFQTYSLK